MNIGERIRAAFLFQVGIKRPPCFVICEAAGAGKRSRISGVPDLNAGAEEIDG